MDFNRKQIIETSMNVVRDYEPGNINPSCVTLSIGFPGIGQVELDAVPPKTIQRFCQDAIDKYFDYPTHERLMDIQREERKQYQSIIRENIDDLFN